LITRGSGPDERIPVETYRLDPEFRKKPSNFRFELLINEIVYDYYFSVTKQMVIEEKLIKVTSASEKVLFYRKNGELVSLDTSLPKQAFLKFAFHGTDNNQLFLTNSVLQKIKTFKAVYDWFKTNLILVGPESMSGPDKIFASPKGPLYESLNKSLSNFDTGITHLEGEDISFKSLDLPDVVKELLNKQIVGSSVAEMKNQTGTERIIIERKDDELVAKKLVSYHQQSNGEKVKFEFSEESDGTRRLIDLLPGFYQMASEHLQKVYIIDELDRSLHSLLTRQLLNIFLCSCTEKTRSQLIFTTHDLLLMDQDIFRRDEMWIAERSKEGVSSLSSFAEFTDVRADKDIRKSYLQGRLGGIPKVLIDECFVFNDLDE